MSKKKRKKAARKQPASARLTVMGSLMGTPDVRIKEPFRRDCFRRKRGEEPFSKGWLKKKRILKKLYKK